MAMTEMRTYDAKTYLRQFAKADPRVVTFTYDRRADTLYVDLFGEPRSAVEVVLDDHIMLSVDPDGDTLVGIQIEGFLARFIYELPVFLDVADVIGLTSEEVERVRRNLDPESRKRAVLESLRGHVDDPLTALAG